MTLAECIEKYSLPEPNSGCILWTGGLDSSGYGRIKVDGRSRGAHRVAYEMKHKELSPDLELDHTCRTKCCVNLNHLEPVTSTVNMQRAVPFRASQIRLTQKCGHGEYDSVYTKHCRVCLRESRKKANRKRTHHV